MTHLSSLAVDSSYLIDDDAFLSTAPDKQGVRVLLIEDSRSDVVLVSRMLRDASRKSTFDITDVPRLAEALNLLDEESFDIVLLDLNLLDIDGVASVAALHADAPNTPIIVYSGTHDPRMRQEALMCGARHYLVKGRESAFSLRFMINQALARDVA